ncbi:S1C family serine protease [Microbacterium sp.]|uniref:S1C family serine protease n=1 Tax=Microbacterium sp. TaxID=51671 RepID=UPI0037CA5B70
MSEINGDRAEGTTPAQPVNEPATPPRPAPPVPPAAAATPPVPPAPRPPYGPPAGYTAHPVQPPRPSYGQYAGQAPAGSAFGAAAAPATHPTQPTLPLDGAGAPPAPPASKRRGGAGIIAGAVVVALLVGGAAGLGGAYVGNQLWPAPAATGQAAPQTVTVNNPDKVNATTAIAAKVVPSVVTISASSGSSGGTGSGVILSADGYVVTNTHVVTLDGATGDADLRVTTSDGHVHDAALVGTDPIYDLAVIKIEGASGLTPIEFADSSALNVGDQTVAVGSPLGLSNSVTTGIVSALNRSIEIASSAAPDSGEGDEGDEGQDGPGGPFFFDFGQGPRQGSGGESIKIAVIQTDAAINPGNSGGALVDSEGRLIGVNVAIATAGGGGGEAGNIGVGFAIPSSIAERVANEIIETGSATHGLLGASVMSAAYVEGSTITGAYIDSVVAGGAAEQGGLKEGDIVTAFNGVPVTDSVDLTAQVRAAAAGSKATVTYVRDGDTYSTDVTLGELQ